MKLLYDLIPLGVLAAVVGVLLSQQQRKTKEIQMDVSELATSLRALEAKLIKDRADVKAKLDELGKEIEGLTAALNAGNVQLSQETVAALARVNAVADEIDTMVAPPAPPPGPTPQSGGELSAAV